MTSSISSWAELPLVGPPVDRPVLVLEGARRDALWSWVLPGRIIGGRIRDRGAAEHLAPEVVAAASKLGFGLPELGAVIVGLGPGSVTGLRLTVAFAKGVACASQCRLVGVPSLPAMLIDAEREDGVAVLEAYAKQVFAAGGDLAADVYLPEQVRAKIGARQVVTDGAVPSMPELCEFAFDLRAHGCDTLTGLAVEGLRRLAAGEESDWKTLAPNYGRPSSAELQMNLKRE